MNSKTLVRRALAGEEVARAPIGPLAVHYCAQWAGITLRQYATHPRMLAESVVRYYDRFRPDAVWVSADTRVSAEAMGAMVGATGDDQPLGGLGPPLVQKPCDIGRIPPPDPSAQGRYPLMVDALTRVVEALGRETFVVACFDQYPFSLAAALLGLDTLMLKLKDDRPMVEALMDRCLEYGLAYARALNHAGADLLSGGDSPAGLIGPQAYREVAWPFERRLIGELKPMGKPVSLHICGNAQPILAAMAVSGADVLELDHQVDLERGFQTIGPGIAVWGNLDPVGVLAQGDPTRVRQHSRRILDTVRRCDHCRFVLSSGCTLAVETPAENLEAMFSESRPKA